MERKLTIIAAVVALTVLLLAPGLHFASGYRAQQSIIITEADINSRLATQLVNANPELWMMEKLRFEALLARRPRDRTPEIRTVYDGQGTMVASVADDVRWPLITTSADVHDAGIVAGRLEISRSLRPLLASTGIVAFLAGMIAIVVYLALRTLPIRALRAAVDSLLQERERASAMEQEKRSAEAAMHAKAQFLANMSHEIRTPLNGVMGITELLLQSRLSPEQQRLAETAYRSGEALMRVINDILDFSKIEAGRLDLCESIVDLRELLEDVPALLSPMAHKNGVEFVCDLAEDLPQAVSCDGARLRQVLTNLIGNAVKFTQQGEILFSAAVEHTGASRVDLTLRVRDTGIGMSAETVSRIFEPFTQAEEAMSRRFGGTGLGLTITKQLVRLMGGELSIESEIGRGSELTVTLPIELAGARATTPTRAAAPTALRARALLLESNDTQRRVLRRELAQLGLEVVAAEDVAAALVALRDACESGSRFELCVYDAQVSGGCGTDLARLVKADPAIASTKLLRLVRGGAGEDAAAMNVLADRGYVLKPVRRRHLQQEIARLLTSENETPRTEPALPAAVVDAAPRQAGTVLLAEDNAINRMVAGAMLKKGGYDVHIAENGREAVEAVSRRPFDLVLMDCQMPEMDGFAATAAIRELERSRGGARLPVIALTANSMRGDRERCLASGFDDYLAKPFKQGDLLALLDHWTGTASGRAVSGEPQDPS